MENLIVESENNNMEGIKKIKEMAEGQKDFVLLEVVKYLVSREDMDEKYLNKEKNLKGMASYIQAEIINDFCKKMNTKNPSSFAKEVKYNGGNTRCLAVGMSEERTYELAINYFSKSNEELGIKTEEVKSKNKEIRSENSDDEFGSIFDFDTSDKKEKQKEEIEQISLFSVA